MAKVDRAYEGRGGGPEQHLFKEPAELWVRDVVLYDVGHPDVGMEGYRQGEREVAGLVGLEDCQGQCDGVDERRVVRRLFSCGRREERLRLLCLVVQLELLLVRELYFLVVLFFALCGPFALLGGGAC